MSRLWLLAVLLCLGACSGLRSEYAAPEVEVPMAWNGAAGNGTASAGNWWTAFGDSVLNSLVEQALASNADLAVAAIRMHTARLQAGQARSNQLPDVQAGSDHSATRQLRTDGLTHAHDVSGSVNYELDLWGRLAAARDAAEWEARATEEDLQETRLVLIGTVLKTYWEIGCLQERIALAGERVAAAERILDLVATRHEAGAVSGLDLVQARQDLAARRAELPSLRQELRTARLTMSLLFQQAPQRMMPEPDALPIQAPPEIPAGVPAGVLARRPDLRAAEWRLRATLAGVDQVRADLYPSITLTGSLGSSSAALRDVLDNPLATLGAGLALPFVQWQSVQLSIRVAENEYAEAVVKYRQALFAALGDVEKALSARRSCEDLVPVLEEAAALARTAEDLTGERYRAGAVALQDWLETMDTRRTAETAVLENRLARLQACVDVYLALGGAVGN